MSSKPRKRSRATVEDRRADCPFEVTLVSMPAAREDKDPKAAKRRKSEGGGDDDKKPFFQISPFEPAGKFRSRETMDTHYQLEPRKNWMAMTKYMSFVRKSSACLGGHLPILTCVTWTDPTRPHSERHQVLQRRIHLYSKRRSHRAPKVWQDTHTSGWPRRLLGCAHPGNPSLRRAPRLC